MVIITITLLNCTYKILTFSIYMVPCLLVHFVIALTTKVEISTYICNTPRDGTYCLFLSQLVCYATLIYISTANVNTTHTPRHQITDTTNTFKHSPDHNKPHDITYTCMHVCMYTCIHTCMHASMNTCNACSTSQHITSYITED